MAFLTASERTSRLWGRQVRWPLILDLLNLALMLWTSECALANAIQFADDYRIPYGDAGIDAPSYQYIYNKLYCMNLIVPFAAMLLSCINIVLYSISILHPIFAVVAASLTSALWLIIIGFWVQYGEKGGYQNYANNVPVSYWPFVFKCAGAGIALVLQLLYVRASALAISLLRKIPEQQTVEQTQWPDDKLVPGDSISEQIALAEMPTFPRRDVTSISAPAIHAHTGPSAGIPSLRGQNETWIATRGFHIPASSTGEMSSINDISSRARWSAYTLSHQSAIPESETQSVVTATTEKTTRVFLA